MKSVGVTVAGSAYEMPISFAAIEQINERVGDPFALASQMTKGQLLSLVQTVDVIALGARLGGCKLERAEIGQAIVEAGAQTYLGIATSYLLALMSGQPAAPVTERSKKKQ